MNGEGFTASAAACLALLATSNVGAEIQIGIAAPLTGSMALGGEQTRAGAIMALEDLNGHGGTLGQMLQPVLVDDFCDPDQAVAAADKLAGC